MDISQNYTDANSPSKLGLHTIKNKLGFRDPRRLTLKPGAAIICVFHGILPNISLIMHNLDGGLLKIIKLGSKSGELFSEIERK